MLGWDHGGGFSLAKILPPHRIHRHRYHGIFAPNAPLRPLAAERVREDNALAAEAPGPPLPLPTRPTAPAPQPEGPEGADPRTPDTAASLTSPGGPLQTDLAIGTGQTEQGEVAQESFPDDLDQTTPFDPIEPEPIPEDHFDQSWGG